MDVRRFVGDEEHAFLAEIAAALDNLPAARDERGGQTTALV
jgi:hypothetical protein